MGKQQSKSKSHKTKYHSLRVKPGWIKRVRADLKKKNCTCQEKGKRTCPVHPRRAAPSKPKTRSEPISVNDSHKENYEMFNRLVDWNL